MRVYLAGPWAQRDAVREFAGELANQGISCTEHWWDHVAQTQGYGTTDVTDEVLGNLQWQAARDIEGVLAADVYVCLQLEKSEGKAAELGMALMREIPCIIYSPTGTVGNVFQYLHEVDIYRSKEEVFGRLAEIRAVLERNQSDRPDYWGTEGVETRTLLVDPPGLLVGAGNPLRGGITQIRGQELGEGVQVEPQRGRTAPTPEPVAPWRR